MAESKGLSPSSPSKDDHRREVGAASGSPEVCFSLFPMTKLALEPCPCLIAYWTGTKRFNSWSKCCTMTS